jgi:VanZ family protein
VLLETAEMSIKITLKVCSVAVLFLLVVAALGPAQWVPRSGLGWRIDHFCGYFALTLTFCFAWQRPLVVGGALVVLAVLLEGLQAFTPDRHADLYAALISASGAMAAVLPANLLIRAPRLLNGHTLLTSARMRLLAASRRNVAAKSSALAGLVGQRLQSRLTAGPSLKGVMAYGGTTSCELGSSALMAPRRRFHLRSE